MGCESVRVVRSIPTCVGFTGDKYDVDPKRPVHPHVRGVYCECHCITSKTIGPSPRAWGLLKPGKNVPGKRRSIPTCVGFTLDNMA